MPTGFKTNCVFICLYYVYYESGKFLTDERFIFKCDHFRDKIERSDAEAASIVTSRYEGVSEAHAVCSAALDCSANSCPTVRWESVVQITFGTLSV